MAVCEACEIRTPRRDAPGSLFVRILLSRGVYLLLCAREDLNLHGVSPTRPSTVRVCHFRHSRMSTRDRSPANREA